MGKRIVKNYPSPRLMETIGATNQTTPEAIGELVANCFDARYQDEKLAITIDVRNGSITVIDNGKGMEFSILEKAVCIAEDMSRYIERGEGAKGHFGMGFKTSCSTLGNYYEIYTRPVDGNVEYYTSFDINDYGTRPAGSDAWDVEIEDFLPSENSPLGAAGHGTAFVISRLKNKNPMVSAILAYMGEAFKAHLDHGDRITIIDESGTNDAEPIKYNFIKGTKVEIDEIFGPEDKYHITGWMALDSQTHNNGFYGFNIYRHNQLIVTASNNVSKKGNINNPSELKKIVNTLRDDYEVDGEVSEEDFGEKKPSTKKGERDEKPSINDTIKNIVTEEALTLEDEGEIIITYLEKESGSSIHAPFDYIFAESDDDDTAELQVLLFKNHPLWKKKVDDDVKKVLATSDAIYRLLVEKLSYDASKALKIRNEWVVKRTEGMK